MDYTKALQLLALREVTQPEPSNEFQWRKIARWYSKTFSTPLKDVDDIPRYDLLQAYWEDLYDNMDETALQLELEQAVKTEEEMQQESLKQAKDTLETEKWAKEVEGEASENNKKKLQEQKKLREELISKKEADRKATENLLKALGDVSDIINKVPVNKPRRKSIGMQEMPRIGQSIEDFSLNFTDLDKNQQEV